MQGRCFCARPLSLVVAILLVLGPAFAQTRSAQSSLRVTVLDPAGAAITSARVVVKSERGEEKLIDTDARGQAFFSGLRPASYHIRVEAEGFEPQELNAAGLKLGTNSVEVRLEVARVKDEVVVSEGGREKNTDPRGDAFSTVLTPEQIAGLPDDPDELENTIRQMGGPGATIRVNGFRGGKLPPKSQIREIRFRNNPYAAESHDAGFISIDILTKPGIDTWHGAFSFGFRDESLNARNAFAPARAPEQNRRLGLSLDGPLWRDRTSLFLSADVLSAYDSKTIVAALPEGNFADVARRPARTLNLSARAEHVLTKTHTARAEYQRNASRLDNLGVGDFDLPERGYTSDAAENILRFSDSGMLTKRAVNEFRFQARWRQVDLQSISDSPTVLVLNAFNRGGAQVQGDRGERRFEIADNVDFVFGRHSMRAGLLIESGRYDSRESRNANGTFTFASLADFRAGRPTTFTRRVGDPSVEFSDHQAAWYWQDDFRVSKSFTLNFGVRHEVQSHLGDKNNFAPRAGAAWSPFKDGRTTLRAGAGIFYDWFAAETFEQTLRVDGLRQRDIVILSPGFPDPIAGGTELVLPPSRIQRDDDLRMPYVAQASLGVERQFSARSRLFVNYFHQRGSNLLRGRNVNAPVPGLGRPDPTAGNITQIESTASSFMHGLSFNLNVNHPWRRLFAAVNYFLSRSTNEADGPLSLPADNFDLSGERGPAAGDVRHRFFAMLNMELYGNLRLGTFFRAGSAPPYNITTGFDDNRDSVSNDRPAGVGRNSARGAGQWELSARVSYGLGFGKPREARAQTAGGPRVIRTRGDGDVPFFPSLDQSNKRWRTELYVQAYNLFNHTNPVGFTGVETSPFFGRPTSALAARRVEAGMRFSF
jgi:hypothetical protein